MKSTFRAIAFGTVGCAALIGLLAGCSSSPSGSSSASSAPVKGSTIVVYSPQGADTRGPYIAAEAEKQLGITVTFVSGGGGDLTTRLLAEKNNTQADVVLGLGEAQMNQVASAGIFEPYTPSWAETVPEALRGSNGDFTLATQTPIVLAYNTDKMSSSDAPTSWVDLAKPEYKDKFTFPAITSQTGQAAAVGILWRFADHTTGDVTDQGWQTLSAIMANSVQVSPGQKFDYGTVASGAQPIVVTYLGGLQTAEKDNSLTMQIVNSDGGSPYVQTGVGLVKNSAEASAAKAFIDMFGSAEFQVPFVTATNNDTPVNADAVKQLGTQATVLASITKQDIDWGVVTTHLTDWLQKIQLGGN
ncbi:extracellular solute-binding protein [Subtercola sp. RTI3]|uniref:extracellular solute-binding protein n=1 Tax=Subtercola sp. RTI3 TaxID=3048639 RepID=UPI002B2361C4|nr:extracellular solute-binding protein [Subtercola sp. RTI3]MEA9987050.1 extracellular solute-binding protein [Subtercola sp. RTI3]